MKDLALIEEKKQKLLNLITEEDSDYQSYLKFKEVQNALVKISQTPGKTYVFNGVTHEKGMTCAQADRVLDNIFNCKTNMEMISLIVKVARQIGFHEITLPRKIRWGM